MEISTLERHIDLIEEQIVQGEEAAEREFQDQWRALNPQYETIRNQLTRNKEMRRAGHTPTRSSWPRPRYAV